MSKGSLVTVVFAAGPKEVPSVIGLKESAAKAKLAKAGFKVETVTDPTTEAEKGTVRESVIRAWGRRVPSHSAPRCSA